LTFPGDGLFFSSNILFLPGSQGDQVHCSPTKQLVSVSLAVFVLFGVLHADVTDIVVGAFSRMGPGKRLPAGWKPWILKNVKGRTAYGLARDGSSATAVMANADNSASGLLRNVTIDPREYPVLRWRWKVAGVIEGADIARKESNDSPARVYVAFDYDIGRLGVMERLKYEAAKRIYSALLPLRAIAYTWANGTPKGEIVPMPYTEWFSQVAVENAESPLGRWVNEERDVYEDYRRVFGEEPGAITGVAIMTNTDNLGGRATAWYGDIVFKKKQ
jgi:hypothetical protein